MGARLVAARWNYVRTIWKMKEQSVEHLYIGTMEGKASFLSHIALKLWRGKKVFFNINVKARAWGLSERNNHLCQNE